MSSTQGARPALSLACDRFLFFVVFSSFWNIFVKTHGLRPKSQGFFM